MEMSTFQAFKLAITGLTNLFADALHIHVALAVLFIAVLVTKKPLSSLVPWSVAVLVLLLGEALNMREDLRLLGYWRWRESAHGLINALIWPTALLFAARTSSLFQAKPHKS